MISIGPKQIALSSGTGPFFHGLPGETPLLPSSDTIDSLVHPPLEKAIPSYLTRFEYHHVLYQTLQTASYSMLMLHHLEHETMV